MDLSSLIGGGFAGTKTLTVEGYTFSSETIIMAKREIRYKHLSNAVFRQWYSDGADPDDFDPKMRALFETFLYSEEPYPNENKERQRSA